MSNEPWFRIVEDDDPMTESEWAVLDCDGTVAWAGDKSDCESYLAGVEAGVAQAVYFLGNVKTTGHRSQS